MLITPLIGKSEALQLRPFPILFSKWIPKPYAVPGCPACSSGHRQEGKAVFGRIALGRAALCAEDRQSFHPVERV